MVGVAQTWVTQDISARTLSACRLGELLPRSNTTKQHYSCGSSGYGHISPITSRAAAADDLETRIPVLRRRQLSNRLSSL